MLKKIAALLSFGKKSPDKTPLKKAAKSPEQAMVDDYVYRYPPFPRGIPATPIDKLINSNQEMIRQIILARGLAGTHNAQEVKIKILDPIQHLAEMAHLLPASEKDHFRSPGGLFSFSLESALFGIRYAERRILTRVTPEIRRENESLWAHAAFLTGLFSEAIRVISQLSVYSEEGGIEWRPGMESIFQWLERNHLKSYHLRWHQKENVSIKHALAGKVIQPEQEEILIGGEKTILNSLIMAFHDQDDWKNPLVRINRTVRNSLIQRDLMSDPSRYGRPLTGMHLEPWLIDAMRHLVEKKRWVVNEDNGRVWHGKDGVFVVWPLAANDMQRELKEAECPFVPNTREILAELLQEAGIIERLGNNGGYLCDIAIPQADNPEKAYVTAIRLVRHEILFEKSVYQPLPQELQVHEVIEDDETNQEAPQEPVDKAPAMVSEWNPEYSEGDNEFALAQPHAATIAKHNAVGHADGEMRFETIASSEDSDSQEENDMDILFGKRDKAGNGRPDELKEAFMDPDQSREMDMLFGNQPGPGESNQYDDDYASDYGDEQFAYTSSPEVINEAEDEDLLALLSTSHKSPEKPGNPNLPAEAITQVEDKSSNETNETADLLSELMGSSKSTKNDKAMSSAGTQKLDEDPEFSILLGKTKPPEKQSSHDDLKARSGMVLNKLKKLPREYLEAKPGGITKVIAKGLKNTQLTLKDCVSVLKAAGLLILVEGLETGMDRSGEKRAQYFLVKADLIHGN